MTGLKWVRLDTSFPANQKIVELAGSGFHRAIAVYACGLAHAGSQGTDGWIPRSVLPLIHARQTDAQHLVDVGLWVPRPGGWEINDWREYQPSSEETAARSARAQAAAYARWGSKGGSVHKLSRDA